jgi:hypothetical protein
MKRKFSYLVLIGEIAVIVLLHVARHQEKQKSGIAHPDYQSPQLMKTTAIQARLVETEQTH